MANGLPSLISPTGYTSTTDRKSNTVSFAELWEPRRTRNEWAAIFDQSYGVHFYHGSQKQHSKFCRTLGTEVNTLRMAAIFDQSYGVHFYHGSQKQHSKFCRALGAKANTWRMDRHL
jgi:hypothetical protein